MNTVFAIAATVVATAVSSQAADAPAAHGPNPATIDALVATKMEDRAHGCRRNGLRRRPAGLVEGVRPPRLSAHAAVHDGHTDDNRIHHQDVYRRRDDAPRRGRQARSRCRHAGPSFPQGYGPGEGNSGLFWRTRNNGEYIGHGGSDPGVQAAMLASVDRRVAVVLLSNTSGGSVEFAAFDAIFRSLIAYGQSQQR
jgi:hypothetical protein